MSQQELLGNDMGAVFSSCGKYRYRLWRRWDERLPMLAFLMLNPSVAGAVNNDQTVTSCIKRAQLGGFGAVEVVNLFALVSTDPQALYNPEVDPIGQENDAAIAQVAQAAGQLVCAWSNHGRHLARERHVLGMLKKIGVTPHVLMLNKDGTPRHPLYVSYQELPKVWRPGVENAG